MYNQELTGSEYPYVQFGKPTEATYMFAEELLLGRITEMYGKNSATPQMYVVLPCYHDLQSY